MAFTLVQADANLYAINTDGGVSAALTLPAGVTLSSQRIPRFARFKNYVVLVNTPSRPLSIGTDGTVRVLTPAPPSAAMTLSGQTGGALTGTFAAKQTYIVLDSMGNLVSESDYGPTADYATISGQWLQAAGINISADTISASRLYRTTDNGAVYFQWIDVDGNVTTTIKDDRSDASLGILSAEVRGSAPDLVLCKEWGGRLWGVGRTDGDNLRWTEADEMYAWGADNTLPVPHVGDDRFGITALAPLQDFLGVGRRNSLVQIPSDVNAQFRPITISEQCGILGQESVVSYRNTNYFLWYDGVYQWNDSGVTCLSDAGNVRSWFTGNSTFNQGMFSRAFAALDLPGQKYRLFLCSAGSVVTDRYVELDIPTGLWYGPHTLPAFAPRCALLVRGTNDQPFIMVGSQDGYLSQDTDMRADWDLSAIPVDVRTKQFHGGNPDRESMYGKLSVWTEAQASGSMTIQSYTGGTENAKLDATMKADLTKSRQSLKRAGRGRTMQLRFTDSTLNDLVVLHGYTIPQVADIGRR